MDRVLMTALQGWLEVHFKYERQADRARLAIHCVT